MAFVWYTHAEIDKYHPRALGVCDRCGLVYNHARLHWQYDWMGAKQANLRILVCPTCMDTPQEQLRQIILPRDPIPIEQPRLEPFAAEVGIIGDGFEETAFENTAFAVGPITPTPYGNLPETTNTSALNGLTNPVPPDTTEEV